MIYRRISGAIIAVIAAGCSQFSIDQPASETVEIENPAPRNVPGDPFQPSIFIGDSNSVDGWIVGDWIRLNSGETHGFLGKGGGPLTIRTESHELPVVAKTDELAEELVKLKGKHVRLTGWMASGFSPGRGHNPQQGFSGTIPDHVVFFLEVDSVTQLKAELPLVEPIHTK